MSDYTCSMAYVDEVVQAAEEMVRRFCVVKTLYPESRALLHRDTTFAKTLADGLGVGPLRVNGATCHECQTRIDSQNRHDFATCPCGAVSVDGGTWYARRAMRDGATFTDHVERWPWARATGPDGA